MKSFISAALIVPSILFSFPSSVVAAIFDGYAFTYVDLYVGNTSYSFAGSSTNNVTYGGPYQPRDSTGLTAYSAHSDFASHAQAVASLAIYGSDTSRTAFVVDPTLPIEGRGVEPMIDAQLSASPRQATGDFYGTTTPESIDAVPGANASGDVSVKHRVVLNSAVDPSTGVDAVLNNIPLKLLWSYDFSGFGTIYGEFSVYVDSPTGDCDSVGGLCGGYAGSTIHPAKDSGSIPFTASATTTSREAIYDIVLSAYGSVGAGSELQAVIDPYLTVDPDWEYASYFTVQQESVVNPGEWVSINRDYLNPVPLPPALWLFGSALAGLITMGRRRSANSLQRSE